MLIALTRYSQPHDDKPVEFFINPLHIISVEREVVHDNDRAPLDKRPSVMTQIFLTGDISYLVVEDLLTVLSRCYEVRR
jgi:hypothetical protein